VPPTVPPGWPRDLPAPSEAEFDARVVGWLLDRSPAGLRSSALTTFPAALCLVVQDVVRGEIDGLRAAYASARVRLATSLEPQQVATVLAALESEGAALLQIQREVDAVGRALIGD
jgi:hypothetical protein